MNLTANTDISQVTVAKNLRCGRNFNHHFTANLLLNMPVTEFQKSVNIYYAGPAVWNSLPDELRNCSFNNFKWFLKTILFSHY